MRFLGACRRRFILGDLTRTWCSVSFVNSPFSGGIDTHPCGTHAAFRALAQLDCGITCVASSSLRLSLLVLVCLPLFAAVCIWHVGSSLRALARSHRCLRAEGCLSSNHCVDLHCGAVLILTDTRTALIVVYAAVDLPVAFGSCGHTCAGLPRPRTSSRPEAGTRAKNLVSAQHRNTTFLDGKMMYVTSVGLG